MSKIRLDQYLCQNGLVQSRERAKALIMSGIVFVNEQKVDKAGEMIAPDAKVEVRGHDIGYVSRGGLKLEKAMQVFPMRPDGKVCMDIGASTGGFTDCMLQNGAAKVYAVDVGYGQLAWSLRTDARVVNMERTNIRNVKPEDLTEPVAFFSVDVSFISLKHIFPVADAICTPDAVGVCLVKPQFEAGREKVGKKGVVREPATHREVLEMAQADFEKGEYQWVAEITNALVYADPDNLAARYLCADALEQLGYQAESGPWRNAYLTAALELRQTGAPTANPLGGSRELQLKMATNLMLEYLGIRLNSDALPDLNAKINLIVNDQDEQYLITLRSGILLYQKDVQDEDADATWRLPKAAIFFLLQGDAESAKELGTIEDESGILDAICQNVKVFIPGFTIIEP